MKKRNKHFKRFIFTTIILTLILITSLFIAGKYFGEKIEQAVVTEINNYLDVEVSVADIEFSLLEKFPYASVRFTDIQTKEKLEANSNSLLKAQQFYILYNISNLFSKNYKIEKIILKDAFINIVVYNDGSQNINVFQPKGTSNSLAAKLQLQKIELQNVQISYINYPSDQEYLFQADNGIIKGSFSSTNYQFVVKGQFYSDHIRSGKTKFLADMPVELNATIKTDNENNIYKIINSNIVVSNVSCSVSGIIKSGIKNRNLDLKIQSEQTSLSSILNVIPGKFLSPLNEYNLKGNISLNAKINGDFTGDKLPLVSVDFNFKNGQIEHPPSNINLKNVSFSGHFNNGKSNSPRSYRIKLKNFKSEIPEGTINGELSVLNFKKPEVIVHIQSALDLKVIPRFININDLQSISGHMRMNLQFKNKLQDFREFTINDFLTSKTSGSLEINQANIKLKNNHSEYRSLDGKFQFNNSDLAIKKLTGFINSSDFSMDGYFKNILPYFFSPDEKIHIKARLQSNNFNLDDNRIFITGFSDGGSASFHLALNEPDYFASFYPLNGRLSVGHALTKLPVYIPNMMNRYSRAINTDLDQLYPAEEMRKVMELAQKAGADLFYKEYWDIGHEFLYAEQEIPIILGDMELHPRNVLRNDIYWETALPEFGKCDWIEIVEIDSTHNPASWHKNHEIELLNKRLSFGFYNDNDYKGNGSKVDNIVDGSAVDEMGIKAGDIIIAMDGQPASDIDELINLRNLKNRGDLFTLTIVRGEEELILNGKFPEAEIYQVFNYDMPSGAVSVKYFANQFHAETSRVGKLAVYIHPDMVNLDIPVTIFVNGLEVFNDIVQIDRDFMLHNFQENLDRKALWVNKLIIECN